MRIFIGVTIVLSILLAILFVLFTQPSGTISTRMGTNKANAQRIQETVHFLTDGVPRNSDHPESLEHIAGYIESRFQATGADVKIQTYKARGKSFKNVIANYGPQNDSLIVIGAHYDVFGDLPGADDNASGTAVLLEVAEILSPEKLEFPIEFVSFCTEEPPFFGSEEMGSAIHAGSLKERGVKAECMICLEMVGYYTENQNWPNILLDLFYPSKGNFLAVIGRWEDRKLTRRVKSALKIENDLQVWSYNGPDLGGLDASDHRNYWLQDISAVMITDTAFIRNPNYHTPHDLPDTLDYKKMAILSEGLIEVISNLQIWINIHK